MWPLGAIVLSSADAVTDKHTAKPKERLNGSAIAVLIALSDDLSDHPESIPVWSGGRESVSAGAQRRYFAVEDRPHAPLEQHFDSVAEQIQQNHTGNSLVFCSAGRSRSPSLIMAFLMRYEGLSLLQAHQHVLAARPFIRPNAGFWRQLLQYEKKLTHSNSIRMVATSQGVLPEAIQLTQDSSYCINV
ncbi:hypothetical protein QQF64_015429 [Cirrhinus molitorella]|uniref:Protein-tyrosine-phosphatase n=1 Tax=Cirrhinus molitorella TaxID=172907 RepID=A0ABR3NUW9_9TELE